MYGLPPTTDLDLLRGRTLTYVGVGRHETCLELDGDAVSIQATSPVGLLGPHGRTTAPSQVVVELVESLGVIVEGVDWTADGTLRLRFAGRPSTVEFVDDDPDYECWTLTAGDTTVVV